MKRTAMILTCTLLLAGCGPGAEKAPIENGMHTSYYYKGGPVRSEREYKDGKLHGLSTTYYKSGNTKTETPYVNGKIHGTVRRYSPGGVLAGEAVFKDGVLVSEKRMTKSS